MGKEITRIKSDDPSNPWPYLVECYSQQNPVPEIHAARAALKISEKDLTIGAAAKPQTTGSSSYYGSIVAKRKEDLKKLHEYLISHGWTVREDEHPWTARRHSPSWGSKPPT
jgi:hypothetical protein